MSYMRLSGLGETSKWLGLLASPSEVYLFRFSAKNANPKSPLDLLAFVRAVGQVNLFQTKLDIRGVTMWDDGSSPDAHTFDVVATSPEGGLSLVLPSASGILNSVSSDPNVQALFPGIVLSDPSLLELIGPSDAIDHWRSQPILWDHSLSSGAGVGGPTDTFASPAEYSIAIGKADDGKRAKPWTVGQKKPAAPGGSNTLLWILGIGAVSAVGYTLAKKARRKSL